MKVVSPLLIVLALATMWRCASQTRIPPEVRAQITSRHEGKVVELRHSAYFGNLYDENEMWLLSPYRFEDTSHIVNLDGAPIHPTGQRGIVPAGTRFVVQKVEFPDVSAMAKRLLTTPRYNPWVYLVPAPAAEGQAAPALDGRKAFIALLPMDLETEAQVEKAMSDAFAPEGAVSSWLASRRPTVRVAIEHKDVVEGMSREELFAAWGVPPRWFIEQTPDGEARVAWYTSQEVWLVGDAVKEIKSARAVDAPAVVPVKPEGTRHDAAPSRSASSEAGGAQRG